MDDHLALRTFLVGHFLTVADLATWAGIRGCYPLLGIIKKGSHIHLARWFAQVEAECQPAYNALNEAKSKKTKASTRRDAANNGGNSASTSQAARSFDVFLPSAKDGHVVTRFPPEPSGYLHLGHTKAAILNQYFARRYNGRLIVRFDDTNPTKEKVS